MPDVQQHRGAGGMKLFDLEVEQKSVAGIGIALVFFVAAYLPVWSSLVSVWNTSEEYSHGFFIVPICLYMLYKKRHELAAEEVKPSNWGLAIVVFSLLIYVASDLAEIITLRSLTIISTLAGIVVYFYGFPMLRHFYYPLFLLVFMIPIPGQIYSSATIVLQLFVTKVSTLICSLLGVPIFREGNVINLPGRTLEVVRACSGLRSLASLMALSAIIAYLTLDSNLLRVLLFVSSIPAAIVANVIRVVFIILFYFYLNFDLTEGIVHTVFGIVIFFSALGTVVLFRALLVTGYGRCLKK